MTRDAGGTCLRAAGLDQAAWVCYFSATTKASGSPLGLYAPSRVGDLGTIQSRAGFREGILSTRVREGTALPSSPRKTAGRCCHRPAVQVCRSVGVNSEPFALRQRLTDGALGIDEPEAVQQRVAGADLVSQGAAEGRAVRQGAREGHPARDDRAFRDAHASAGQVS